MTSFPWQNFPTFQMADLFLAYGAIQKKMAKCIGV